jgi:glutamine synthetase adenylyltransferase
LDAYERLRGIEKSMRIASEQAPNVLPSGRELELLARAAGRREPEDLSAEVRSVMQETRRIFTRTITDFAK